LQKTFEHDLHAQIKQHVYLQLHEAQALLKVKKAVHLP
jgi:hypothetical protein